MARPTKEGLDYFPLDVHLNDKIRLLEAKHGTIAFAIIIKIYQKIYGKYGYYCKFDDDICLLFASETIQNFDAVKTIINEAINRGIFNKNLYDKYHVLTSERIQETYFEAISRRKNVEVEGEYLLLADDRIPVNVSINGVNVNINKENAYTSTQSKVNKSKVNKSKEDDTPDCKQSNTKNTKPIKHKYGEYKNVLLSDDELEKLKIKFPLDWNQKIEDMSSGIEMRGYKYKSHYLAILKWANNDDSKNRTLLVDKTKPDWNKYNIGETV